ncbi:hypothetical protein [Helicobacter sp. 13S00477-4]|uniref:hypothetical protein n=1 Tax=Helicobacter sp. 13S00477-4 TaxID=1905759 RepID=UPI000BA736FE|nr:hypothetical protein [Helicobacter sp. 13S00477-4]PAF50432.1 hypothetical protein BKH44_08345 [Helicobacter sp. 13S00477-4]
MRYRQTEKVKLDFGNARRLCEELGISYSSYSQTMKRNAVFFRSDKNRKAFKKLLENGYIVEVKNV